MSIQALAWVLKHSKSKLGDRLVLLSIADNCHEDGTDAYPSVATIAAKARVDRRTVQRCVRNLVAMGELEVSPSRNDKGTLRYRIIMGEGATNCRPGGDILSDRGRQSVARTVLNRRTTRARARAEEPTYAAPLVVDVDHDPDDVQGWVAELRERRAASP